MDSSGNVYVADAGNNRIRKISASGIITTIVGNGTAGYTGDGSTATSAELYYPCGVAMDRSGNVYIADQDNNRIRKVNVSGIITTIAGDGTNGYSGDGGTATSAELYYSYGVAVDGSNNIYIADADNHRIRKISATGIITTIAGNGTQGYSGDGGAATSAELNYPYGVAVDGSGNIYIADKNNYRIRKVNASGTITTIAGNGIYGYNGDGGTATSAKLSYPYAVAVDGSGNLYVADYSNNRIRKISTSGIITTVAGNGTAGYTGDGGTGTSAELNTPSGVAVDGSGNVYIADIFNRRIRKISTSGIITTIAGNGTAGYSGDGGAATSANLSAPTGVTADSSGNVYIADGNRIRKVSASGIITTLAGNGTSGYGGDGGAATSAALNSATGVAVYGSGNVYIADANNSRIRLVGTAPTWLADHAPAFMQGAAQNDTMCAGTTLSLNTYLAISDSNAGQTETWSLKTAPLHGMAVVAYTVTSTGSILTPTGLSYTPTPGYSGMDSFSVKITDGTDSAFTIVHVIVNGAPGSIGGASSIQVGNTLTFTDGTAGGIWHSSNTDIAVTDSATGRVTGVASGTCTVSYTGCGTVTHDITVTSPNIYTVAGNGTGGYSGDGGVATAAELSSPQCVAADISGNIYIADFNYNCIRKLSPSGIITTIAGNGTGGFSGDGGAATLAELNYPTGVTVDSSGNIYIADYSNNRIRKVNTSGIISTIAGNGTPGYSGDGGTGTSAKLYQPGSVAIDGSGNVYIADEGNNCIRKLSTLGIIMTIAGNGTAGYSGDGGAATSAKLYQPASIAVDGGGNLFIADQFNNSIRKVNASGIITTIAGNGMEGWDAGGYGGDGGAAASAQLNFPSGVTADGSGNVYIADFWNNRIRKINSSGIITTIAGNGTSGYSGDDGEATSAKLWYPAGIAVYGSGNVYIADNGNNRIRLVGTAPSWLTEHAPAYTHGTAQNATTCTGVMLSLNTILAINDSDAGQTETWSLQSGPAHGTLAAAYSATSTGGTLTPTGLSYIPTTGYSGIDSFSVKITDGTDSAYTTVHVTINPAPNAGIIFGAASVCAGSAITLTDTAAGGTWSSSAATVATVTGGAVTGVAAGTATISCTITNSCGIATAVKTVTVNPLPNAGTISGAASVCAGSVITLTDTATGGTWGSSAAAVAIVSGGTVTGVAAGTATISYTTNNSCGTATVTKTVTVNPAPNAGVISGAASVCAGSAITLTDTTAGGTWSSSAITVATVSGGMVTGVTAGTAIISYTKTNSCGTATITKTVTVNPAPGAGVISGAASVCAGSTITLTDTASSGTWGSSAAAVATVSGGTVTGVAAGTATISYTKTNSCGMATVTKTVTVNPAPDAGTISGAASVCAGSVITLTDTATGGTWGSSTAAVATVSGGTVTGVAAGTATISYTKTNSCGTATVTKTVTVNPAPNAGTISGAASVCAGSVITLTDTATGGTWGSSTAAVATVSGDTVTGVAAGTATISYTKTNSCGMATVTKTVTVNPAPDAGTISGVASVCAGSAITLTDTVSGGAWTSSNTTVATVSGGTATGVAAGSATISYTKTNGCGTATVTKTVTVNGAAGSITGTASIQVGNTVTFTDAATGGTWRSSDSTMAVVGSATGIVTGIAPGACTISYSNGCGAAATYGVTVTSPNIYTVAGNGTYGYSGDGGIATSAGLYNLRGVAVDGSGNFYIADESINRIRKVNASGIITTIGGNGTGGYSGDGGAATSAEILGCDGIAVDGSGNIYIVDYGNNRIRKISASGIITTIAGNGISAYGGDGGAATSAWLYYPKGVAVDGSGNVYIADQGNNCIRMVSASTGIITTIAGNGTFGYSGDGGAATSANLADPAGVAVDGSGNVYIADEENDRVRKVSTSGIITTIAEVNYPTGVATDRSGNVYITEGESNRILKVTTSGIVTIIAGNGTPSYSGDGGVATSAELFFPIGVAADVSGNVYFADVNNYRIRMVGTPPAWLTASANHPPAFTYGASVSTSICYSATANISSIMRITDADTGQTETWTLLTSPHHGSFTGFPYTATSTGGTLIPTGLLYSPAAGFSGLDSFTVKVSDGLATIYTHISVTVKPLPVVAVTGSALACMGHNDTLTGTPAGGVWTNTYTTIGSLSAAGIFTPLAAGTATVKYTATGSNGCTDYVLDTVNVRSAPVASGIAGSAVACPGTPVTLTDAVGGGIWSASNAHATISSAGVVTGISNGADTISYTVNNGCGIASTTKAITIGASAGSISGPSTVCAGSYISLTDAVTSGTWSSSNTGVATVSTAGRVTGVAAGTTVISYAVSSACGMLYATDTITVNTVAISGSLSACVGSSDTLTGVPAGGTWFSSSAVVATISAGGVVTAVAPGTTSIKYTVATTGCSSYVLSSLLVHANPVSAAITGAASVCNGHTVTLADATPGGTWSATNGNATVSAGRVTGAMPGTDTILYTLTNSYGCATAKQAVVTVNNCGARAANTHTSTTAETAAAANGVRVYPNPSSGTFTVEVPASVNGTTINVYDAQGRLVASKTIDANSSTAVFNLGGFAHGTYVVRVQGDVDTWTEQVTVY